MSAAAMFLIPAAVSEHNRRSAPTAQADALPAQTMDDERRSPVAPSVVQAAQTTAEPGTARRLRPAQVSVDVPGFYSWALLDRGAGDLIGSPNLNARSDTASMIKAWLAADHLRRASVAPRKVDPAIQRRLSVMIRDSDNAEASRFWVSGGGTSIITRMIKICGLTDSRAVAAGQWSTTEVSARDTVRLAVCIADGRAAGPTWTPWLLNEMRSVRGVGRFGIISAMSPEVAPKVAIKNGWVVRKDSRWHMACLAVTDEWALSVLTVYPANLGFEYGANVCKQVAVQLGTTG
jgi:hypothetical protein